MNKSKSCHEIPGLRVLVDGFRHAYPGCQAYFLSHYHGDHYSGITEDWNQGTICCTPITAALLVNMMRVRQELVQAHDINVPFKIPGATVTFLDANHCPGAALIHFACDNGKNYLHCGDMRYSKAMLTYPLLMEGGIARVYLDTTYGHPKHVFQPQLESIAAIVEIVQEALRDTAGSSTEMGRCLILLSAYNIGKERILLAVAKATGLQVYCDERKQRILNCLGLSDEERNLFTSDMRATPLHTCRMGFCGEMWPFFKPNFRNMTDYLEQNGLDNQYTKVLGIIPTGWADSSNWNRRHAKEERDNAAVHLVPYSEHSNFTELQEFVRFIKPCEVMPTVFSDQNDYAAIARRFTHLLDHTANKRAFFAAMQTGKAAAVTPTVAASGVAAAAMPEAQDVDVPLLNMEECGRKSSPAQSGKDPMLECSSSVMRKPRGGWACHACTYWHAGAESSNLRCSICGTMALNADGEASCTSDDVTGKTNCKSATAAACSAAAPATPRKKARKDQPNITSYFKQQGSGSSSR